jgi:hypothetical protein
VQDVDVGRASTEDFAVVRVVDAERTTLSVATTSRACPRSYAESPSRGLDSGTERGGALPDICLARGAPSKTAFPRWSPPSYPRGYLTRTQKRSGKFAACARVYDSSTGCIFGIVAQSGSSDHATLPQSAGEVFWGHRCWQFRVGNEADEIHVRELSAALRTTSPRDRGAAFPGHVDALFPRAFPIQSVKTGAPRPCDFSVTSWYQPPPATVALWSNRGENAFVECLHSSNMFGSNNDDDCASARDD